MDIIKIQNFSKTLKSEFKFNYNIKKLNWFNIGGNTEVFFKPDNLKDLVLFLKNFGKNEKIFVLGAGSNILFNDKKFEGIIIKLGKNFSNISLLPNNVIVAGSATTDKKLADFAMENSIGGLEFLSCIPGTIGGGIRMNAGCFGKEFKDILLSIQAIDSSGNVITLPSTDIKFEYRKTNLPDDLVFLSASFKGIKGNVDEIKNFTNELKSKKEKAQPTRIKTSGSTFKNPISQTKKKVWELIKDSVPLDKSFGDACISEKHCNFFVNKGNATFEDMSKLINFVSKKVLEKTGINLEKEIKILE